MIYLFDDCIEVDVIFGDCISQTKGTADEQSVSAKKDPSVECTDSEKPINDSEAESNESIADSVSVRRMKWVQSG